MDTTGCKDMGDEVARYQRAACIMGYDADEALDLACDKVAKKHGVSFDKALAEYREWMGLV